MSAVLVNAGDSGTDGGVVSSLSDTVWTVRLDRPAKRNALTMSMFRALAETLPLGDANPDVRALLICGTGPSFCAGHDLAAFQSWPQARNDPVTRFLHALDALRKPLVLAIDGSAVGIGATMMLHADWVVCAFGAMFRLPFVDLGIAPEAGSSALLTQAIGLQRAKRLLLGGEPFSAEDAFEWGLVSELVPSDELSSASMRRASLLAGKDPLAVAAIKDWLKPPGSLTQRIDEEIDVINRAVVRRRKDSRKA